MTEKPQQGRNLTFDCLSIEKQTKWDGGWVRKYNQFLTKNVSYGKNNDEPSRPVNGPTRRTEMERQKAGMSTMNYYFI
jgi:hypothetical protein